jgi:hypothetical protein
MIFYRERREMNNGFSGGREDIYDRYPARKKKPRKGFEMDGYG